MDFNDCPHVAFLKVIHYYCSFSYVAVVAKVVFLANFLLSRSFFAALRRGEERWGGGVALVMQSFFHPRLLSFPLFHRMPPPPPPMPRYRWGLCFATYSLARLKKESAIGISDPLLFARFPVPWTQLFFIELSPYPPFFFVCSGFCPT